MTNWSNLPPLEPQPTYTEATLPTIDERKFLYFPTLYRHYRIKGAPHGISLCGFKSTRVEPYPESWPDCPSCKMHMGRQS